MARGMISFHQLLLAAGARPLSGGVPQLAVRNIGGECAGPCKSIWQFSEFNDL